ncbi:methyltransferase domain-containing protein [Clostridium chromiireducens]|uniref:Methyltransferase domain-containing protein n=1 Tax=Clostridium chromiireducens TaxID=225345 RepID=A0A964RQ08_9CLOT|nr:class I SAM-dependent methyltransferase [Clostridium chromiireducens]MVX65674.1 methyltransferase domain-containing protein [Clostridium chromiireducens]
MDSKDISTWELLQKKMVWEQLKFIRNKRILDFGSGNGMTANHFAIDNEVVAIEPSEWMLKDRFLENDYTQIQGDVKKLKDFADESFDVILCHNVFEYVDERKEIIKEFSRLLKKKGYLSVLKHNRAGRVMQMVVLLNNFEHANELLEGKNGYAEKFGSINYYEDKELLEWSDKFELERTLGLRTFWDLQQNQEIQKDTTWQQQMLEIELKVSELEEYKSISSFHHVILRKK